MTKNELIAKEQFVYLNSRGKPFVLERMIENGVARNEVETVFADYKKEYFDARENERASWFSLKWSAVGAICLLVCLKLFVLKNNDAEKTKQEEGAIAAEIATMDKRCPIYLDPITCLKSVTLNHKIVTCTYCVEKTPDEEIANAKEAFNAGLLSSVNKGEIKGFFAILERGYLIRYVVQNEAGKEMFSVVKSKENISATRIIPEK